MQRNMGFGIQDSRRRNKELRAEADKEIRVGGRVMTEKNIVISMSTPTLV
jgi:hypothetical protein